MYAVIKTGGKQYRVAIGEKIKIEQILGDVGTEIVLDQILAVAAENNFASCHALMNISISSKVAPQAILEKSTKF